MACVLVARPRSAVCILSHDARLTGARPGDPARPADSADGAPPHAQGSCATPAKRRHACEHAAQVNGSNHQAHVLRRTLAGRVAGGSRRSYHHRLHSGLHGTPDTRSDGVPRAGRCGTKGKSPRSWARRRGSPDLAAPFGSGATNRQDRLEDVAPRPGSRGGRVERRPTVDGCASLAAPPVGARWRRNRLRFLPAGAENRAHPVRWTYGTTEDRQRRHQAQTRVSWGISLSGGGVFNPPAHGMTP